MFDFFEAPWGLLIVAVVSLLVLLIVRMFLPDKRRWWQFLLPGFLVVAAFGLDYMVETEREQINAAIGAVVKAVEDEDPAAIGVAISEDYRDSYHNSKQNLIRHLGSRLSEPLIAKNIKRILEMNVSGQRADVVFTVRILFDERSSVYQDFKQIMLIKIKAELQKEQDKWLFVRIELMEVDMRPAKWDYVR